MDLVTASVLLLGGSVGLLGALVLLIAGRKALRDARESASTRRRGRYYAAFAAGDRKVLRKVLGSVRDRATEVDLAIVLRDQARLAVDPAVLDIEARRSGLTRRLHGQLGSHRPPARGRAVLILTHLRLPGRVGQLERMLGDDDPDVRLVTCAGLPLARDADAVGALIRALSRRQLAPERVIERLGQPWAVDALLDALHALDEPGERQAGPLVGIVRALGVAGDRRAEPVLIDLLREGGTEERISAARALGGIGEPGGCHELERALKDPSWPLRAQAAKALAKVAVDRSAPALEAVLDDPAWWVRANAATALRGLGAPGRAALERALTHDDPFARDRAHEALAIDRLAAQAVRRHQGR